jgi:hypothetical protein
MGEIKHSNDNGTTTAKKRKADQLDTPATNTPTLTTPCASPTPRRSVTPNAEGRFLAERGITFHNDDTDDEYEYIRLPKKRDFDIVTVAHNDPNERTTSNLPLVATRHPDKAQVTLWAKVDTGADVNVINRSTIKSLLGDKARTAIHPLTVAERDFVMLGDTRLHPTHYVLLTFQAGRSKTTFEKEKFYVVDDTWGDSNADGVPNVVLGWTFLMKNSLSTTSTLIRSSKSLRTKPKTRIPAFARWVRLYIRMRRVRLESRRRSELMQGARFQAACLVPSSCSLLLCCYNSLNNLVWIAPLM